MKRLLLLILVISAILCVTAIAEAPAIDAKYGIVYNLEADKPLFEKDVDSIIYPASLTKIMTGLLACEYYDARGGNDFEVTVSEASLESVEGNKIGLKAGETVSFYDLIVAVMVGSGNDAAYVIAEVVGGSLEGFIDMMNERALSVGATHTTYSNPSGFHSPYMLTTLRDQALICAEASENNTLLKISSLVDYTMPETNLHKKREFTNQNLLFDSSHWLRHYTPNTRGFNAGMTQQAGWCLATLHDNDGLNNVVIVAGGSVEGFEYNYINDVKALIDYSKKAYAFTKVLDKGRILHDVDVKLSEDKDRLILTAKNDVSALLPIDTEVNNDIRLESELFCEVYEAPISEGDTFGVVRAYYGDELLGEAELVALTDVKLSVKLLIVDRIKCFFENVYVSAIFRLIGSLLFVFAVCVFIFVCIKRRRLRLKRMRARAQGVTRARKTVGK